MPPRSGPASDGTDSIFTIRHICPPSSLVSRPSSFVPRPSSLVPPLSSVIRPLSSILCPPSSVFCPPTLAYFRHFSSLLTNHHLPITIYKSASNFSSCRSLSTVALAKADVFVAEKTAQIFEYFRTFHIIFRIFSNVFECFRIFSNVFERF